MNAKYSPVMDRVWQVVRQYPNKTAASCGGNSLTYAEFEVKVKELSRILNQLMDRPEEAISVMLPPSLSAVVSLVAVFEAGGVYQPIAEDLTGELFKRYFTGTGSQVIVTHPSLFLEVTDRLRPVCLEDTKILTLDDEFNLVVWTDRGGKYEQLDCSELPEPEFYPIEPESSAYLFYTSGSTGLPKGILGKHDSISHFISWQSEEFKVGVEARVAQLASLTFDASLRDIFLPLSVGGEVVIPNPGIKESPELLLSWLKEKNITHLHTIPSLLRVWLKEVETFDLPSLQYLFLSGEMLYTRDVLHWREKVSSEAKVVNFYGPTETTMIKTFQVIDELPENPSAAISVGKPISSTVVAVINEKRICRPGQIGEVYIKTPYWTKGYYKNERLTQEVFVPNPLTNDPADLVYKTGDKARYLKDGRIELLGRMDREVKINGVRANLEGIERALRQMPCFDEVYLLPLQGTQAQELICYFTTTAGSYNETVIRDQAGSLLDKKIIPTYFVRLEHFPIGANGKIDKSALPKPREVILQEINYVPVVTSTEAVLEDIWKEVLDLKLVGRNASFFNMGGSSLSAVQVIARVFKRLQVMIGIKEIFNHLTLKELARFIDEASVQQEDAITSLAPGETYPASNAQKRIWSLHQYNGDQIAYNISEAYEVNGSLDEAKLKMALEKIVASQESLRTTFAEYGDEVVQHIHKAGDQPLQFDVLDINLALVDQSIHEIVTCNFDLTNGPLYKVKVLKCSDQKNIVVLVISHIISDAWSMKLFFQEMIQVYQGVQLKFTDDTSEIHYKEYVHWINEQKQGEKFQKSRSFWLNQFEEDIQPLTLTNTLPRPLIKSFEGDKIQFQLSETLTSAIHRFQEAYGFTPYMILLTQVKALLYCYSGQKVIVIGNPVSGRARQEFEKTIGLFVNTLPIRSVLDVEASFASVVETVKRNTLDAYAHDLYPMDELVAELGVGNDPSRSVLFDVMVQLQDLSVAEEQTVEGMDINLYPLPHHSSKFDLTFDFKIRPSTIDVEIEFQTDIYTAEFMQQFSGDLLWMIEHTLKKPVQTLKELKKSWMEQTSIAANDESLVPLEVAF